MFSYVLSIKKKKIVTKGSNEILCMKVLLKVQSFLRMIT